MRWKLKRWLYGMRPAARVWEEDYPERFESEWMNRGLQRHRARGARALAHGEDFVVAVPREHARCFRDKMREWYDLRVRAELGCSKGVITISWYWGGR